MGAFKGFVSPCPLEGTTLPFRQSAILPALRMRLRTRNVISIPHRGTETLAFQYETDG